MYHKQISAEIDKTSEEIIVETTGKTNAKGHLQAELEENMNSSIVECLGTMLKTEIFQD